RLCGHISTGAADIPAVRFPADRDRLGRALDGTGPAHRDAPDFGENQESVVQGGPVAELRVSGAVVAVAPVEARVAGRLTRLHAAEEGLEGAVYALYHVLQDLAVDLGILRQLGFDAGQFGFLLVVVHRDATLLPGFPAYRNGGIVDMTAEHEGTIKHPLLFGS